MGSSRIKKYDRNRFRKVYPRIRVMPSTSFRSTKQMVIETMEVDFAGESEISFDLAERYNSTPTIVATPTGDNSDVNIYIKSVTVTSGVPPGRGTATITLATSVGYAGSALVQSILIVD